MVIIEETWLYRYGLETKQQSMEWRYRGSPCPQKKSAGKVLASTFWDQDAILIDYLAKGQTINAEYYSSLRMQFKEILRGKRSRKVTRVGLLLARQCLGSPGTYNPEETGLPGPPVS